MAKRAEIRKGRSKKEIHQSKMEKTERKIRDLERLFWKGSDPVTPLTK